jgi:hypothetical protein
VTQVLATTVVVASLYALLAAGYVLVYRATRVLNLAQGDMMTLGGYFLFFMAAAVPGRPALSIVTAAVLSALAGFAIYRLLMRPMAGHPIFAAVLRKRSRLGSCCARRSCSSYTDRIRHRCRSSDWRIRPAASRRRRRLDVDLATVAAPPRCSSRS